jgi:DNA (cytosine-5)-methyltransferase 1
VEKEAMKPTAVDLFCGAGGLTWGLKKAGFKVLGGVERYDYVARTYHRNHPDVELFEKDIRDISGEEIKEKTKCDEIDLVAGCPPCQGFSKLTDKYHRSDYRNELVYEMARLVEEIQPKMVMMENVPGLQIRGKPILDEFILRLKAKGYEPDARVLQMADYGVPQSRRRLVLLAGKGFKIPFPRQTHAWKPDTKKRLKPWLKMSDIQDDLNKLGSPITLSKAVSWGGPQKFNWHVVRDLQQISIERLKAIKEGEGRRSLPENLRPKCHAKNEGFENVYGRLSWNETPPTMTGGCTTPCKGRFGHPNQLRTISVREAALIQTFPRTYKFDVDSIEDVCNLIGNALPPKFAKIAAKSCVDAYKRYEEAITSEPTNV